MARSLSSLLLLTLFLVSFLVPHSLVPSVVEIPLSQSISHSHNHPFQSIMNSFTFNQSSSFKSFLICFKIVLLLFDCEFEKMGEMKENDENDDDHAPKCSFGGVT